MAGVKYSFEMELRDRGQLGFVLPVSYIQPVGEEAWSAVRVLASHIVSEEIDDHTTAATTATDSVNAGRSMNMTVANSSRTGQRMTALFSVCAVLLLKLAIERLRLIVYVDDYIDP